MTIKGDHGRQAEQLALEYLQSQTLKLVCKNYHCRYGEIDLIMKDKDTLVFVEVRYRKNQRFGGAIESIDFRKQQKIKTTASHYLQTLPGNPNARFDVVLLNTLEIPAKTDWIKSAFE